MPWSESVGYSVVGLRKGDLARARDSGRQTAEEVLALIEAGCVDVNTLKRGEDEAARRIRQHLGTPLMSIAPLLTGLTHSTTRRRSSVSGVSGDGNRGSVSATITKRRASLTNESTTTVAGERSGNSNRRGSFLAKLTMFVDREKAGKAHQSQSSKDMATAQATSHAQLPPGFPPGWRSGPAATNGGVAVVSRSTPNGTAPAKRGSLSELSIAEKRAAFEAAAKKAGEVPQMMTATTENRPSLWKRTGIGGIATKRRLSQLP